MHPRLVLALLLAVAAGLAALPGAAGAATSSVSAPSNTSPPTVSLPSGQTSTAPLAGTTLSASVGAWTGTSPLTYTYQWKQCEPEDTLNSPCFTIQGATASTFVVPSSRYGRRRRVEVTATNSVGAVAVNSAATEIVTAIAPVLNATPQIVGQNVVGQTLSLTSGTRTGSTSTTFSYSWNRCDPPGTLPSCVAIANATAATYAPSATQQQPSVAGTPVVGDELSARAGVFAGDSPIKTTLQWQRCDGTAALHFLRGTPYDDVIIGGPGNETIDGGGGYDTIRAGKGNVAILVRGSGSSTIFGGTGSATIYAANGYRDRITCTGTHDRVVADPFDLVTKCALVTRTSAATLN